MTIRIGPYVAGEIPEPLVYAFLDAAGVAINLTGYTASFRLRIGSAATATLAAVVTDAAAGQVTHTWLTGELTAGQLFGEFIATGPSTKFYSARFVGTITAAL